MPRRLAGFTLVELVVVIALLAILAAVGLPRFLDLGRDARVASLQSAVAALRSGAEAARVACIARPSCGDQASISGSLQGPGGVTGVLKHGYPTGLSRVPSYFGIKEWVDIGDGLVLTERAADFTTVITAQGAPDPSNCQVTYSTRTLVAAGMRPEIQITTSGC